jgi:hypothetical protein
MRLQIFRGMYITAFSNMSKSMQKKIGTCEIQKSQAKQNSRSVLFVTGRRKKVVTLHTSYAAAASLAALAANKFKADPASTNPH